MQSSNTSEIIDANYQEINLCESFKWMLVFIMMFVFVLGMVVGYFIPYAIP